MSDPARPKKVNLKQLLILLPILLCVAVAVNWTSIVKVATGEWTLRGVLLGMASEITEDLVGWEVPGPAGAEDAKVVIDIFLHGGDPCHADFLFLGQALGTVDPDRVRVVFQDTSTEEAGELFKTMDLGCEQGLAVNGKTEFTIPLAVPEGDRKDKTIFLTKDGGWTPEDFYMVLDNELKKAYDGKGLDMTSDEMNQHLEEEVGEFRDKELELAKARRELEEAQE